MKRRTPSYITFLILFCAVSISLGFAQQQIKVGVINSSQILEKSEEGKRVIAQLQDKDKKTQGELARMDEEIRKLETRLNTQRLTLSEESILQMSADLERKRTERKRHAEDSMRDFQELQIRLYNKLQNELMPIIRQLGKEEGFDLIFDWAKSGVVYFNPTVDITEEVIKRYNASKAAKK